MLGVEGVDGYIDPARFRQIFAGRPCCQHGESGEAALEKLVEQTFDVVVSDMGMNGWDLAAAVKSRWPDVRFLLATGWGAAIDSGEARSKGVEAVLNKPYLPADLLRVLGQ